MNLDAVVVPFPELFDLLRIGHFQLVPPPGGHGPHVLNNIAAQHIEMVVKVKGDAAVRW